MRCPSFIQFYPTLACNQKCNFCFNQNIYEAKHFTNIDRQDALSLVLMLSYKGIPEIDVLGGEPFLVPWIADFIAYATNLGMRINVSTNGSLPLAIHEIVKIKTDHLSIGFSLHGFDETHNRMTGADNFSKALSGINAMIASGMNPVVKSVLIQENMREIARLVKFLEKLGVRRYYLMHEDIIGRKGEKSFSFPDFWRFYTALRSRGEKLSIGFVAASGFYVKDVDARGRCNAGIKKLAILPDGSVFPCNLFSGFKEFSLGNVFDEGIEKLWASPVLRLFREFDGRNRCNKSK
ncbi:MAG: radical SAM protein, partial [Nitrospirota bacterium]